MSRKCYLIVVLICLSTITNVKHLVLCLSTTCVSSLEKCLFRFFAHLGNSLAVQWLGLGTFIAGWAWVWSLVREPRSHMMCSAGKKKKQTNPKSFLKNQVVCFFCCWVIRVLYIFWILIPYQIRGLQKCFPILWASLFKIIFKTYIIYVP